MNCRDFRELADSYLSDELAVETNHQVFKHLENCADCRAELSSRREIRTALKSALKLAPEYRINPSFAAKLRTNLEDSAARTSFRFSWKIFVPVFAVLLIVLSLGVTFVYRQNRAADALQNYLVEMSHDAVGDHQHCALENLKYWEKNAGKVTAEQTAFIKSLQNSETEILAAHDCEFEGKTFTHYILRRNGRVISVSKIASENPLSANKKVNNSIICEREDGLQVASFEDGTNLVFVISDMSETENLSIARTLSDSLKS